MKTLLVMLLLCFGLNAEQNLEATGVVEIEKLCEKFPCVFMEAKRYSDNTVHADTVIKSLRLSTKEAGLRGFKDEFLGRIVAHEDNKTVFDLIGSEYLSKSPMLEFKYKSLGAPVLTIETIDNNGNKDNVTQTITEASSPIPLSENKSTGKEGKPYRVNIPAINTTFGDIELVETDKIQLTLPDAAYQSRTFPVNVSSDIKAKSVTLFAIEENAQMKFICQWQINEYSIIDYSIEIKLNTIVVDGSSSSILMIVVQGEDGKFYTTEKQVYLATGGYCS